MYIHTHGYFPASANPCSFPPSHFHSFPPLFPPSIPVHVRPRHHLILWIYTYFYYIIPPFVSVQLGSVAMQLRRQSPCQEGGCIGEIKYNGLGSRCVCVCVCVCALFSSSSSSSTFENTSISERGWMHAYIHVYIHT